MSGAFLHGDSETRKRAPMCEGLLWYFPDALAAIAAHSLKSNERHNPGERLHHAREKSTDHPDCIIRHLAHAGPIDAAGIAERVAVAWRALAFLQEGVEERHGLPLPHNAGLSPIIPPPPEYNPDDVAFRSRAGTVRVWPNDYLTDFGPNRDGLPADSVDIARGPLSGPDDRL